MNNSKLLLRHAFILDLLCLLLCAALLLLGTKDILPFWMLVVGALIAFVALVASIWLFVKARKLDREESRRIEAEILKNAAREDGGYIPEDSEEEVAEPEKVEAAPEEKDDYKADDEQ